MAVCTTRATLARCDASKSAKNGNRSPMTDTASVASRPEYCFSRRSRDSGTVSSSSSGDRGCLANGPAKGLSLTPKTYAKFLDVLANAAGVLTALPPECAAGRTVRGQSGGAPDQARIRPGSCEARVGRLLGGGLHVVDPVLAGGRD